MVVDLAEGRAAGRARPVPHPVPDATEKAGRRLRCGSRGRLSDPLAATGAGMEENAIAASALFEEAVAWLQRHYGEFEF